MTEHGLRHDDNSAALAAALAWLRARLATLAESNGRAAAGTAHESVSDDDRLSRQGERAVPATLQLLSERLGMSPFERDVLLLCCALELDPRLPALCARASSTGQAQPTFALALELFDDATWSALSPHGPLRRLRLLEVHQPAGVPLIAAALRADERIVNFIKGLNEVDDRLTPLFLGWETDATQIDVPPSQSAVVDDVLSEVLGRLRLAGAVGREPLVQLVGTDHVGKQLVAQHACRRLGLQPLRLPATVLPRDFQEQETLLRLWERESLLLPICLYIDAVDVAPDVLAHLQHFLPRLSGIVFLDTIQAINVTGRPHSTHEVPPPTPAEQRDLWLRMLPAGDGATAARMSAQFRLDAAAIHEIAAVCSDEPDPTVRAGRLWRACRSRARPRLDQLAQRVEAKAGWDQLVLPDEPQRLIEEIIANVAHRGRVHDDWGFAERLNRGLGLTVLFAGESGTGKTMAAEVIARELDLDLYRIDLSAVVNKYIGETEKNLRKIFDAAEAGGVILFFDEADALFGKRTEVKDSHDRYANIEVNYLLQRMESFRGLAILATNLKGTLDQAFLRRLRYVVDFPLPDRQQRQEIWRRAFPDQTPLAGLDYQRLAQLPLTGGNVHSIVINTAFAAAGNGGVIDMPHLLRAARTECKKLKKPLSAADFHWQSREGRPA
jgi:hypothetical protein